MSFKTAMAELMQLQKEEDDKLSNVLTNFNSKVGNISFGGVNFKELVNYID